MLLLMMIMVSNKLVDKVSKVQVSGCVLGFNTS